MTPRLGYLDPHQIKSAFGNLKNFLFTCEAVGFSVVFDVNIKGFE